MSKELEALERLKYIYAIDKETHRNDLNIIEKALTPPTEQELLHELNNNFKVEYYVSDRWEYDGENIKTKLYYGDGSHLNLYLEEMAISEFIKYPKLFKMVSMYFESKVEE